MTEGARTLVRSLLALGLAALPGCYDNVGTSFDDTGVTVLPDGGAVANLAPWEMPNVASVPAPTATDACPEMLNEVEVHTWMGGHVAAVHAAGCIHASPAMVWQAIQDPETAHDPSSTNSFSVIRPPMPTECNGPYQTQLNAGPSGFTIDFRLCWRHLVAMGTDEAPLLTESRWQKVWGSTAIRTLEGSLVSQPHPSDPENITEVFYQYHLDSASLGPSNYETINGYLNMIFARLVTRSHGTAL
jgi:hypothetical protein